eukprot:COSAG05_NODE_4952_length_1314_cov_0.978601_2_plen_225_part_01
MVRHSDMAVVQLRASVREEASDACSPEALANIARAKAEAARVKAEHELAAERQLRVRAEERAGEAIAKAKLAYSRVQAAAAGAQKAKIALARAQQEVLTNIANGHGDSVPAPGETADALEPLPADDTFGGLLDAVADFVGAANGSRSRPTREEVAKRLGGGRSPKRDRERQAGEPRGGSAATGAADTTPWHSPRRRSTTPAAKRSLSSTRAAVAAVNPVPWGHGQ